jgi:hypothetical protein
MGQSLEDVKHLMLYLEVIQVICRESRYSARRRCSQISLQAGTHESMIPRASSSMNIELQLLYGMLCLCPLVLGKDASRNTLIYLGKTDRSSGTPNDEYRIAFATAATEIRLRQGD